MISLVTFKLPSNSNPFMTTSSYIIRVEFALILIYPFNFYYNSLKVTPSLGPNIILGPICNWIPLKS